MKIEKLKAFKVAREESSRQELSDIDSSWLEKIEKFSKLCDAGTAKTHIAFLGTSILAKATEPNVNLYEIKPTLAADKKNSYSARTLCHSVLVPLAAELGINIGVTGREPLNNQPYFRMVRLGDDTPIHPGGKRAFDYMLTLIKELSISKDNLIGRKALRAFLFVRTQYQKIYSSSKSEISSNLSLLPSIVSEFVTENSEGGRRAQAVVAGFLDVCYGRDRVESGRINDPSRKYPGDVCVRSFRDMRTFDVAYEVRDKSVKLSDIQIFGKKCIDSNVYVSAIVMASENQEELDIEFLENWSSKLGLRIALFFGWQQFISQALFWAVDPSINIRALAVELIEARLKDVEVSVDAIEFWHRLTRKN